MPAPEPPSFHLRLPPDLKARLQAVRGRNSLNTEIVARLERSLDPDDLALQVADILRPVLAKLDESARAEMATLLSDMLKVLGKTARRDR
ncbi:hypothetical protein P9279_21915 [Mesorhizobium sp. WSM4962]|uniref:hypothetical protein n=1 Tax=Mesorhizobium sp. WSM4962 TaxID=3038548 RepID=UPI002417C522|nr:hypothetical protein [Mesorhizobium sp. WSM4962]MDG4903169.1 hypothetical protein [Mesorhizobium sp. WSM4962]